MLHLGDPIEMTLNLKFLRVQSGMTLEQLATDSGLTRSYLSKLERGLSSPSIGSALKIAKALEYDDVQKTVIQRSVLKKGKWSAI